MKRLLKAGLQIDIDKCDFEVRLTKYLGMIIEGCSLDGTIPGRVRMDPAKLQAIADWQAPNCVKDVLSFLGFANFYRRFIEGFSKIAAPLTNLCKKDVPWNWSDSANAAFLSLKEKFLQAPVLQHFDPEKPCTVETDASDFASGGVLSQPDNNGQLRPVAYFSKRHLPAECNYEIYDKELMAIVRAFEEWHPELEGSTHPVDVVTDHKNLEYFMSSKKLSRRQARWSEFLSRFDFVIKYRPGHQCRADGLSRRSQDRPNTDQDERETMQHQVVLKKKNLAPEIQATSSTIAPVRVLRRTEALPEIPDQPPAGDCNQPLPTPDADLIPLPDLIARAYRDLDRADPIATVRRQILDGEIRSQLVSLVDCHLENERLFYQGRLWIPESEELRLRCVKEAHNNALAGHPGKGKTLENLQRLYYWPRIQDTVRQFVKDCPVCARIKPSRERHGLLQALPPPSRPWTHLTMDFVTDLPESTGLFQGAKNIWVITDRLSKERHLVPCHSMSADHLVRMFIHYVVRAHGLPSSIVSDRGTQFTSDLWRNLCKSLGIKAKLSTAYHPESDGETERANQVMEQYLRAFVNYLQDDWAEWLPLAEFAANNLVNESTGLSPFFVNKGFNPRTSLQAPTDSAVLGQPNDISQAMQDIHNRCREELTWAQALYTASANESQNRRPAPNYQIGDRVWLSTKNIRTRRPCKKLEDKCIGPYRITRVAHNRSYELDLPRTLRIWPVFHVSLLRPASPAQENELPRPILAGEENPDIEWDVKAILGSRHKRGKRPFQYRVQWATGEPGQTWEPVECVDNCAYLVNEFHAKNPSAPTPPARRSSHEIGGG